MPINSPDVFDSIGDAILASGGGVSTFVALNDTPSSYAGSGDYLVSVNAGASALTFIDPNTVGRSTFTALNDTPASYSGSGGFLTAVNVGATALEFIDPTTVGRSTFIALNDTPASYAGGAADAKKLVQVSAAGNTLEFTDSTSASLDGQKIKFDVREDAYGATGDHEGELLKIGTASQTQGDVLYWAGADWAQAQANAVSTSTGLLAIAHTTGSPGTAGALHQGFVQLSGNPGGTAGDVLYLDDSGAGRVTNTAPTASGSIVRVMGYNIDAAGLIYFNPSPDWLEIV
jgi:hypothetical protein